LTGRRASSAQGAKDALKALYDRGVAYPLLKAHPEAKHAVERVYDGAGIIEFGGDRLDGEFEGVALSAWIAAHLARGQGALDAIDAAKRGAVGALREAVKVGKAPHKLAHPLGGLYQAGGLSLASVLDDPNLASGLTPSR
jgi:hydroxymethylpyrimidine/phosphomethylpyrimidine kinase